MFVMCQNGRTIVNLDKCSQIEVIGSDYDDAVGFIVRAAGVEYNKYHWKILGTYDTEEEALNCLHYIYDQMSMGEYAVTIS